MANTSRKVFFFPFTPFDPSRKLAFRHSKLLVVDDALPSPARSWRMGDVAHFMEEHSGDGHPGNIIPVVGLGDGDQMASAIDGSQFLVGGKAADPRGPPNHGLQHPLKMNLVQLGEQILEIQGPAPRTRWRNPVRQTRSHPGEDPAFHVPAALARAWERVQGRPDPFPEIRLDLGRGLAERLGNLANPTALLLHQPPPLPSAGGKHQRHLGVPGGDPRRCVLSQSNAQGGGFAPKQIQDKLDGGADHRNRPVDLRSRHLRTGAKVLRWRAQGPNRSRASRWPGVG